LPIKGLPNSTLPPVEYPSTGLTPPLKDLVERVKYNG
jgi:hypothetical protein